MLELVPAQTRRFSVKRTMDECVTRKEVVSTEQPAMECDFCDSWEHVACVRECDRVDHELYEALMKSRSKNILYMCSKCRKLGPISKCICKLESECECLSSKWLASARVVDEGEELIRNLRADNIKLQAKLECVEQRLWQMTTDVLENRGKVGVPIEPAENKADS